MYASMDNAQIFEAAKVDPEGGGLTVFVYSTFKSELKQTMNLHNLFLITSYLLLFMTISFSISQGEQMALPGRWTSCEC